MTKISGLVFGGQVQFSVQRWMGLPILSQRGLKPHCRTGCRGQRTSAGKEQALSMEAESLYSAPGAAGVHMNKGSQEAVGSNECLRVEAMHIASLSSCAVTCISAQPFMHGQEGKPNCCLAFDFGGGWKQHLEAFGWNEGDFLVSSLTAAVKGGFCPSCFSPLTSMLLCTTVVLGCCASVAEKSPSR